VVGRDGTVFEVNAPTLGQFDTSKSFQLPLEDLMINQFKFKSVKADILVRGNIPFLNVILANGNFQ